MPVELSGTYYNVTEIAEILGLKLPAASLFISRGGYQGAFITSKGRGKTVLFLESEVKKMIEDREKPSESYVSSKKAALKIGCTEEELISKKGFFTFKEKEQKIMFRKKDIDLASCLADNGSVNWNLVQQVMSSVH